MNQSSISKFELGGNFGKFKFMFNKYFEKPYEISFF